MEKPLKLNLQHETSLLMVNGSSSGSADLLPLILVLFLRGKKDCTKLVERLTSTHTNLNVSSLNYGCDNEDAVAKFYAEYQERGMVTLESRSFHVDWLSTQNTLGLVPHQTGLYMIPQATLHLVVLKLNVLNLERE